MAKGRLRSPSNYSVFSKWHVRPLLRAERVAWKRRIEHSFFWGPG